MSSLVDISFHKDFFGARGTSKWMQIQSNGTVPPDATIPPQYQPQMEHSGFWRVMVMLVMNMCIYAKYSGSFTNTMCSISGVVPSVMAKIMYGDPAMRVPSKYSDIVHGSTVDITEKVLTGQTFREEIDAIKQTPVIDTVAGRIRNAVRRIVRMSVKCGDPIIQGDYAPDNIDEYIEEVVRPMSTIGVFAVIKRRQESDASLPHVDFVITVRGSSDIVDFYHDGQMGTVHAAMMIHGKAAQLPQRFKLTLLIVDAMIMEINHTFLGASGDKTIQSLFNSTSPTFGKEIHVTGHSLGGSLVLNWRSGSTVLTQKKDREDALDSNTLKQFQSIFEKRDGAAGPGDLNDRISTWAFSPFINTSRWTAHNRTLVTGIAGDLVFWRKSQHADVTLHFSEATWLQKHMLDCLLIAFALMSTVFTRAPHPPGHPFPSGNIRKHIPRTRNASDPHAAHAVEPGPSEKNAYDFHAALLEYIRGLNTLDREYRTKFNGAGTASGGGGDGFIERMRAEIESLDAAIKNTDDVIRETLRSIRSEIDIAIAGAAELHDKTAQLEASELVSELSEFSDQARTFAETQILTKEEAAEQQGLRANEAAARRREPSNTKAFARLRAALDAANAHGRQEPDSSAYGGGPAGSSSPLVTAVLTLVTAVAAFAPRRFSIAP